MEVQYRTTIQDLTNEYEKKIQLLIERGKQIEDYENHFNQVTNQLNELKDELKHSKMNAEFKIEPVDKSLHLYRT